MNGFSTSNHILSWTIHALFLSLLFSLSNIILIKFLQNILIDNVFIMFWFFYFFITAFSMNVLSILINSVVSTGQASYTVAYGFLLFTFVFQGFLCGPDSINFFYSDWTLSSILLVFFNFYPGYNYVKIYSDLVFFSGSKFDVNSRSYVIGNPLNWS